MVSGAGLHQENTKGGNDIDGHSGMPDAKCDCQHLRSIPASRRTAPPPPPPPPRSGQKPLLAQTIRLPVIVLTPISGYHQPVILHHCFLSVSIYLQSLLHLFTTCIITHPFLSPRSITQTQTHADTQTLTNTDKHRQIDTQTLRHHTLRHADEQMLISIQFSLPVSISLYVLHRTHLSSSISSIRYATFTSIAATHGSGRNLFKICLCARTHACGDHSTLKCVFKKRNLPCKVSRLRMLKSMHVPFKQNNSIPINNAFPAPLNAQDPWTPNVRVRAKVHT